MLEVACGLRVLSSPGRFQLKCGSVWRFLNTLVEPKDGLFEKNEIDLKDLQKEKNSETIRQATFNSKKEVKINWCSEYSAKRKIERAQRNVNTKTQERRNFGLDTSGFHFWWASCDRGNISLMSTSCLQSYNNLLRRRLLILHVEQPYLTCTHEYQLQLSRRTAQY